MVKIQAEDPRDLHNPGIEPGSPTLQADILLSEPPEKPLVVKNLSANAGDIRETDLIPGLGRSPGEGMATHSSILAWRIPWTEEPGGLQSMGSQRVAHDLND